MGGDNRITRDELNKLNALLYETQKEMVLAEVKKQFSLTSTQGDHLIKLAEHVGDPLPPATTPKSPQGKGGGRNH